jgi:hypothetical protein
MTTPEGDMEEDDMAQALCFEVNQHPWSAVIWIGNQFYLTNEHGERFLVTVEKEDD